METREELASKISHLPSDVQDHILSLHEFVQEAQDVDFSKWLIRDAWTTLEAASLINSLEPSAFEEYRYNDRFYFEGYTLSFLDEFHAKVDGIPEIAKAIEIGLQSHSINSAWVNRKTLARTISTLRWAKRKGLSLPNELLAAIPEEKKPSQRQAPKSKQVHHRTQTKIDTEIDILRKALALALNQPSSISAPINGSSVLRALTKASFDGHFRVWSRREDRLPAEAVTGPPYSDRKITRVINLALKEWKTN